MSRLILPLALAAAPLLAEGASAQTGVLDQDNSTPTNITVWMEFAPFLYQQVIEIGVKGEFEGFALSVAPSQTSTPTLPVKIYEWNDNLNVVGPLLWSGGVSSTNPNMTWVYTDASAASLNFEVGDLIAIEVGIDSMTPNGWNLNLNSGWDSVLNQPFAQYDRPLYADGLQQPIDRLCFQTWMFPLLGDKYCDPANLNSSGFAATLQASGSELVSDNDLTLEATELPPNQFGFFLNSETSGFLPFAGGSQGDLCLSGSIGRYNAVIFNSGAAGTGSLALDLLQTPTPSGAVAVLPGETWYFQCWYRDLNPGATSNFSNGLEVQFQ